MLLLNRVEKHGHIFFKYRGQFPVIIFLFLIPFLYFLPSNISEFHKQIWILISVVLCCLGLLIRFYTIGTTLKGTSGRNRERQIAESLNSEGIYSIIRHPLYLGNYFIWLGVSFFTYNIYFLFTVTLLFWLYYGYIIFIENQFLLKKFGNDYIKWCQSTNILLPSFANYKRTTIKFSIKSVLRREYPGILAVVIAFTYIDILRIFMNIESFEEYYELSSIYSKINPVILYVLIFTLILASVLKLLKKYTNELNEKDRS